MSSPNKYENSSKSINLSDPSPNSEQESPKSVTPVASEILEVESDPRMSETPSHDLILDILESISKYNLSVCSITALFIDSLSTNQREDAFIRELKQQIDRTTLISQPFQQNISIVWLYRNVLENQIINCQQKIAHQNTRVGMKLIVTFWPANYEEIIKNYY